MGPAQFAVDNDARRVEVTRLQGLVLRAVCSCCGIHIRLGHEVGAPHEPHRGVLVAVPASRRPCSHRPSARFTTPVLLYGAHVTLFALDHSQVAALPATQVTRTKVMRTPTQKRVAT